MAITAPLRPVGRLPHAAAFWTTASVFLAAMAFTTIPTPLYALYQERDGFPTWVVTVIFATYAAGVALSLYLVGHVSDWIGRKPPALVALAAELVAGVLFLLFPSVPVLLVARFVTGLGVGVLTAAATAHLGELWRGANGDRRPGVPAAVATIANIGGIGLGPLVGGVLAEFAPRPLVTPYLLSLVVLALAVVAVLAAPETVERRPRRWSPQRLTVPEASRGAFAAAGAGVFGAFAIFGLFTSLAPSFLAGEFHSPSRLVAGAVPFAVFAVAAVAQVFFTPVPVRFQLVTATAAMVVGLAGLAVAALVAAEWLFVLGGTVAGLGVGLLFRASLGVATSLVPGPERGGVLAAMFLIAYVGLTVPVLLVGAALAFLPAVPVLVGFSAAIAVLVAIAGPRMAAKVAA
ncbi:MFS transporter [Amnibacterium kyonggiense]|uniref:MFS transporter n=1 Tax=Amnibacterium kyonggiense TaxID=595671 RepID=A0A4R7FI75_9MICO|nr:MFS transporter [Amnibacterium kyonggiense]TDS75631.1 MFS transporter [Amnibacterium kyonggiense]